ncbi:MAG: DUF938 domain-containing protein [Halocynthiibacter sp.]
MRSQDAQAGYKDAVWMRARLKEAGLTLLATHDMPANNQSLIARKS